MSAAMGCFLGTQERVRNSHGKRAVSVRVIEVLLYTEMSWKELFVIVIDLFNETVLFNHRGGRSPPRLLNRQSS